MQTAWAENITFEDLLNELSKELGRQQRRSSSTPAADFLGPGMSSLAIQIGNWNDPVTLLNGNYFSEPGALHGPDSLVRWTGSTIAKSNGSGMQQVWNTDDLDNVRYYMRTYVDDGTGQGADFSDWRNFATPSGYIEFENIDPAYTTAVQEQIDAVVEGLELILPPLKVYRQATEPANPDGDGRALQVGDQWLDTDDDLHAYIWVGDEWVDYAEFVLGDLAAQVSAAQAAAEAAADAAADAMGFAVTLTKTYFQTTPPSNPDGDGRDLVVNDTWFDEDDTNRAYLFDGSDWVEIGLATEDYAQSAADAAESAAIAAAAIDATTKAGNAQSAAIAASVADALTEYGDQRDLVDLWTYPATNKIDGGDIQAGTVTTNVLNVVMGGGNLLADSGFNNATASAWTLTGATFDTGTVTTPFPALGVTERQLKLANGGQYAVAPVTVTPGLPYTLSAWFDRTAVGTGLPVLTAYDVTGAAVIASASPGASASVWQRVKLTFVPTHASMQIIIAGSATLNGALNGTTYVDAVQLEQGDVATAYAPRTDEILPGTVNTAQLVATAINGMTVTGAVLQTTATASRGIKITTGGFVAYTDGTIPGGPAAGTAMLAIDPNTGSITMRGDLTSGSTVTGAVVTGGTLQSEATAARGIKITSGGLIAYNSVGTAQVTIDATTGAITLAGSMTGAGTITGPLFQTSASNTTGIKISSSGMFAYNNSNTATFTLNASTGALTLAGTAATIAINSAIVTGGTIQTDAAANTGIKMDSAGFVAYGSSSAKFTVDATTGNVVLAGTLTGGGSITGPIFQTTATASRGVKISSGGFLAYTDGTIVGGPAAGTTMVTIDATTGAILLRGGLTSGSTIDGTTLTGGTWQTSSSATVGIKVNSSGLVAYGSGIAKLAIDATTGSLTLDGTMTGGGTITGPVFQTASSGERIVVRNDGSGGIIESYSGFAGESPGFFDPSAVSSRPSISISPGSTATFNDVPLIHMRSGSASNGQININAGFVSLFNTIGGNSLTLLNSGSNNFAGSVTTDTDLQVAGHMTVAGTGTGAGFDSWQVVATATTTANSAANVTITGLSQVVPSPGITAVFMVDLDLDWQVGAGITGIAELLVDGVAQTAQMIHLPAASTDRIPAHKRWRITGLTAGNHTFTARHRSSGANSIVFISHSLMTIDRKA